ncbi:inter-alpha-trypsin inhibitor heavy chain H6 [Marmota marmota marmota]|uniref:inter-alpha-trypsin inhibitor heavy chain H6 n=1 Tax=Marmota marmota marmota TaxID=9994 RepID=UPI00209318AE|nr:inter-alpha-trypsin inhibitor heavy chain H6 [Marmota marmota marmota]
MSEWRYLICVSFLLTIFLELTCQGPPGPSSSSTKLLMTSYSIRSTVVSRYAHTLVTSVLFNPHAEAHEAIFDLDLPHLAFISNFTMTINNKVYVAEVKEKRQAKKIYEEAYHQGKTAAHVGIRIEKGETCVRIIFCPTMQDQSAFSSSGIMADFMVQYDVVMEGHHWGRAGLNLLSQSFLVSLLFVQIYGGYFIHYFAPRGLQPVEKNVVFVIDVSGSMFGTKMKQTKKAMNVILSDLQANDYFNIISFSDTVSVWKAGGSIQATIQNVHSAKDYLGRMEADGWTDINAALLAAASVLNHSNQEPGRGPSMGRIPLIIFLTDGEPTAGVTTPSVILSNIRQALGHRVSLFSLAFGDDADFPLLRRLSLENRGVARRIYEDTDAALQLEGLYEEISMPLLADVRLDYLGGMVGTSSWALFPNYFGGSELVVAGQVQPGEQELGIHLAARGPKGQLLVTRHSEGATNGSQKAFGCPGEPALNIALFIRRLWAYVTIRELLEARFQARDTTTRHLLAAKILNLSLEYNFVTPLTSLVMVQPKEASEEAKKQPSTTAGPTTIMPSSSSSHGLGTGTAQPALVPKVSPKSRPIKQTSTAMASTKMSSSNKLEPLGQSSSALSTLAHPKPKTPVQDFGTLAHPTLKTKPVALTPSNSSTLLLTKSGTPSHQNPGVTSPMNSKTQVLPLSSGILAQTKGGPQHSKPDNPSRPKTDSPSHSQPGVVTSQSPKSLSQPRPGVSILPIPKHLPHTRPKITAPKTPNNLPHPRPGILLPKTPKILSPLKPSTLPHQTSINLSLSKPGTPTPHTLKTPLPPRPARPRPPPSQSFNTFSNTVLSSTGPSSTMTNSVLEEPLPAPLTPTPPSLLPTGRLWPQQDLLLRPQGTSTLSEAISLLLLPEELELLSESMMESKFVESLNPPAFYTFLTPDKDGNPHWDGDSEEILGGTGGSMDTQGSSVGSAKGTFPRIFTFSSSVDGDPHFVIHIPHSEERICFTLDGRPGDLLQLIEDPKAGLHVSGKLLGAPPRPGHKDQTRTYFQIIKITTDKPQAYTITISRSSISVQGESTLCLSWDQPALVRKPQLKLQVAAAARLTLHIGNYLEFLILRHRYRHPSTLQLPHLGFYVANGSGLSSSARGLIGQFQHTNIQLVREPNGPCLRRHQDPDVPVVLGKRLLKESPRLLPRWASCWLVKRSHVEQLLGQPYLAYVL